MSKLLSFVLATFIMSPIWPLGTNPMPGDPFIIINKKTNELAFVVEDQIQGIYAVATGKSEEDTPEGLFNVTFTTKQPSYSKLNIAGGDPKNPLGTRWIGIDANDTNGRVYGIHGTNRPDSIGKYVSQGCVRMNNADVEQLYEYIPLGTKVLIVNTEQSFTELAKEYGALSK